MIEQKYLQKYLPALIAVAVIVLIVITGWRPGGPLAWKDRDFLGALIAGLIAAFFATVAFALMRWAEKSGDDAVRYARWFVVFLAVCLVCGFGGASVRLFLGLEE
jgi:hypothetical protein